MRLIRYYDVGRVQIKPYDKEDKALFEHCAGGMCAVTEKKYAEEVEALLFIHGVTELRINCEPSSRR